MVYVGAVVAGGALALAAAASGLAAHPAAGHEWLLLSALAWLSALFALRVPGAQLTMTVAESLTLMVAIAHGWQPAVLTVAVEGLLTSLRQRSPRLDRALFNMAEPALSMAACGLLLDWLSGMPPAQRASAPLLELVLPAFCAAFGYFLLNSGLIAGAIASEAGAGALNTWRRNIHWLVVDQFGATSLALLVIAGARGTGFWGIVTALPLLGTLYAAYRSSIRRAEEALSYAERLNKLYLGTVESLASAIDAKDQVTHGHITRVRRLAGRLADRMGLVDQAVVRAIEAGALLHDVGKLGVPDHILNKPGPLTPAEYDQVKRHTIVGADIVSRVDYPYPVAPIVRHHHENWDGSGYPDGLEGADIPIGARILSVIDCYDALTSDRPYRRAMSHDDAIAIVVARRGSMYDPSVVDAFVALPREDTAAAGEGAAQGVPQAREGIERGSAPAVVPRPDGPVTPFSAHPPGGAQRRCEAILAALGPRVLEATPASTVALFVPGQAGLSMHLAWAAGRLAGYLSELRPELGRGLSGWVAAHRRSLINADGELEFRDSLGIPVVPRCVLSLPVEFGASQTVGVLTLYSDTEAFTAADHELLQALAHAIGNCPSPSQPDRSAPGPASATAGQAEHADERLAS